MKVRLKEAAKAYGWVLATGAATWLFSWIVQLVCALLAGGPKFDITGHPVNLLAVCSVTLTGAIVFAVWILTEVDSEFLLWVLSFCLLFGAGSVIHWAAFWVFAGTPVSNQAAQISYGVCLLAWGVLASYVLLPSVSSLQEA